MTILTFTLVLGLASFVAGLVGALTGLGGGVVIVPLLVIGFGVDIRYAIGASLVSVIATSSGAAAAYVKEGYSNVKLGMLLEIATTVGALSARQSRRRTFRQAHSRSCSAWCCCTWRSLTAAVRTIPTASSLTIASRWRCSSTRATRRRMVPARITCGTCRPGSG